jgi:transcriptional regulator with XRE-family HTH domain
MDDLRAGRVLRALRLRLGWTQRQLAERSGLTQQHVSLIERGHSSRTQARIVRLAFGAVDASVDWDVRWRGGALDRLLDERHAGLVGATADLLTAGGWVVVPEVTYSVFGERGSIDLVAWDPGPGTLLIVEVKSELAAIEATLRKHDEKTRLGPQITRDQFSWQPSAVVRLLVLPDDRTSRRRVERAAAVLDRRYPLRGWELRQWLRTRSGAGDGLLFLSVTTGRRTSQRFKAAKIEMARS